MSEPHNGTHAERDVETTLLILGSYLLGSVSPAYILCRTLRGCDLRTLDSGNLGARNIGRVVGTWAGVLVLVLDAAKGFAAVAIAIAAGAPTWVSVACGASAVAGHNWPFYLGFRGGRGAATAAGAALAVLPLMMSAGLLACVIILRTMGSLYIGGFVAIALPTALALFFGEQGVVAWSPVLISLPLFVRHVPDVVLHLRDRHRPIP